METQIKDLQINMTEIQTNLKNFGNKLDEHIINQKDTDKKVDNNFAKIFDKIDHLSDTFQTRIGDKANEAEVRERFDDISNKYVTKDLFGPVQKIVYGIVGAASLSVLYALINLALE